MGAVPSAATAGSASNLFSILGTGLNAVGAYQSGVATSQQYSYQAQVARNNALISQQNAGATLTAGSAQESAEKLRTGETIAAAKAAQASSGIDIGVGSPVATNASSAVVGGLDAALIHYNAMRAAYGEQQTAQNYLNQAGLDEQAASNSKTAGALKALTTVLGGASSLSSKWNQFALAGVGGGPKVPGN